MPNFDHPIEHLKVYLKTLQTNEPINRAEGKVEQADLEKEAAGQTEHAIQILEATSKIMAWPQMMKSAAEAFYDSQEKK